MSWEPVIPIKFSGGAGVRACIRIHRSSGPHRCIIALGDDVLRVMRWEPGSHMTVLRGTGEDLGRVRLSRAPGRQGYKLQRIHTSKAGHHQYGLSLPLWYGMPQESHRMTDCHWEVSDNRLMLDIRLPRWAISDHGFAAAEAAE